MPPVESKDLKQTAVLWPWIGYDNYGKPIHGSPVELSPLSIPRNGVRWLTKRRMMTDAQGNVIALDATAVVAQKIDPDSLMWLGTLSDWYGTGSADTTTLGNELMIVKMYNEAPDIKNRSMNKRRDIGMLKYKGAPTPTLAPPAPTGLTGHVITSPPAPTGLTGHLV